jgi:hypothetical protein
MMPTESALGAFGRWSSIHWLRGLAPTIMALDRTRDFMRAR